MIDQQFFRFWKIPFEKIKQAQTAGQTIAIVGLYGIGKTLFADMVISLPDLTEKILINLKDIPSPTPLDIYKLFYKQLAHLSKDLTIKKVPQTEFEFHYFLREVLEKNPQKHFCFIVKEGQNLLHFSDVFFDALEQLRYYFEPRVSFIFFGQPQLFQQTTPGLQRLIRNNYYFLRPYDRNTTISAISLQEQRFKISFSSAATFIIKYSQGHHGTIKFLCQKIATHHPRILNQKTFSDFINDDPLLPSWFQTILNSLTHNQQLLIYKYLSCSNFTPAQIKSLAFKELVRLGFFHQKREKISFLFHAFHLKLTEFIKTKPSEKDEYLKVKDNIIYLKDLPASDVFNPQETRLLKALLVKQGYMLTVDQLGEIIWGKNNSEKFSLWAINKLISRVRTKFTQYGLPKKLIQTIPKQGYMLLE